MEEGEPSGSNSIIMSASGDELVRDISRRVFSFITNSYSDRTRVDANLKRLQQLVVMIKSVVEEAEGRHITNQQLLRWFMMFIEGSYRGEYVLETFKYRKLLLEENTKGKMRRSFDLSPYYPTAKRFCVETIKSLFGVDEDVCELNNVLESLEGLARDVKMFMKLLDRCEVVLPQPIKTCLYMMDYVILGRQVEKEQIINFLLKPNSNVDGNVDVLPIIGDCQTGKTTLVSFAYSNERVRTHFSNLKFYSWCGFSITQEGLKSVGTTILKQLNCNNDSLNNDDFDSLSVILKQKLSTEKFLIILDGVWEVDETAWNMLWDCLSYGKNGSKIIITSRRHEIARLGTVKPIKLKGFHKEENWFFFREHAFGTADPEEHPKLTMIGREAASRLQGFPRIAKVFGQQLRENMNVQFWSRALQSIPRADNLPCSDIVGMDLFFKLLYEDIECCSVSCCFDLGGDEISLSSFKKMLFDGTIHEEIRSRRNTGNPSPNRFKVLVFKEVFPSYCMHYIAEVNIC